MDPATIFAILDGVPWKLLIIGSAVAIIFLIAKRYYDNLASYYMFRSNKDLGKNVKVVINGKSGYIVHYTWRFIYVKLEETHNELVIPITKWTSYTWEICRNGVNIEGK